MSDCSLLMVVIFIVRNERNDDERNRATKKKRNTQATSSPYTNQTSIRLSFHRPSRCLQKNHCDPVVSFISNRCRVIRKPAWHVERARENSPTFPPAPKNDVDDRKDCNREQLDRSPWLEIHPKFKLGLCWPEHNKNPASSSRYLPQTSPSPTIGF